MDERLPIWLETEPDGLTAAYNAFIPDDMVSEPANLNIIRGKEVLAIAKGRRASLVPGLDLGDGPRGGGAVCVCSDRS